MSPDNFLQKVEQRQASQPEMTISTGDIKIPVDLMLKVERALKNGEDFGLRTADSLGWALFVKQEFFCIKGSSGTAVTHIKDPQQLANAIKLAIMTHQTFVDSWLIKYDPNYIFLTQQLQTPIAVLQ
jgi:hypothetical protein